jgi:transcriptional regulator with XRE-family HTH domain
MDQLKRLRTEKGLSQAKLAALADIDPSTVNQIERGAREASPATLRKLAQALDVSLAELLEDAAPKAQAPLPLEEEDAWRQGWQSIARARSELLEEAAELWDAQLDKGQYDWQTLKAIDSVGFRLALNHILEESEMKRWLTRDELAQLARAEKRYEAQLDKIADLLRQAAEEQKKKLSEAEVVQIESYLARREAARQRLNVTA